VHELRGPGFHGVLRVHRPEYRTPAHVRSELRFLEALPQRLRVPRPVRTRGGDLVVEGERTCDVLTWVEGRVLRPTRGLGPAGAFALGEALGLIHTAPEPPGLELPEWDADSLFSPSPERALDEAQRSLFRAVVDRTREAYAALAAGRAPRGVVHHDFILGNCHFVRRGGGWSAGVLDFDDLGRGFLLHDLAPMLGNLVEFPGYGRLRAAFLSGYRSVADLPQELESHLPMLMAARHASTCAWLIEIHRTRGDGPPVREHLAYRFAEIRRCLSL